MRAALAVVILAGLLAGCGTNQQLVREEKRIVVMPPASLFNCPGTPAPPAPKDGVALTQAEVADYLLQLYQNQQVCQQALDDVKAYLKQAEQITNEIEGN